MISVLVSSVLHPAPAIGKRASSLRSIESHVVTTFQHYAIVWIIAHVINSRNRIEGECASKPPPEVVSRMRIGMRIEANAHPGVNARIRIECAFNAHYSASVNRP